ncbi:Down syndrome cell adhesion molecule-like protein Dscam2, partial [Dinothrombium tinctorium]
VQQNYVVEVYDEFVIVGNTAVLRCHIPGFIKESVEVTSWIQDSTDVIRSSNLNFEDRYTIFSSGELLIRGVEQKDALKSYRCQTRHKLTGETLLSSTSGRLFVTESFSNLPPRITESKTSLTVAEGQRAEIPCVAQGFPVPSFSWFRWDPNSPLADNMSPIRYTHRVMQLQGVLIIRQASLSDSGRYRCVVNNSVGSESIETELIVTSPLSVTLSPSSQTIDVGKTAAFNCSYSGHPALSIDWYHNGHPIAYSSRLRLIAKNLLQIAKVDRSDKGMYQCFVSNDVDSVGAASQLTLGDGGLYECTASNDVSAIKHSAKINIFGPPYIRPMRNVSTVAGETMVLHCPAGGYPIESIIWEKGKRPAFISYFLSAAYIQNLRLPHNHRQKVFPNGTLIVSEVERATDEGRYKCVARNKEGKSAQNSLYVIVFVRPVIDAFSFSNSLHQGQRYNVLCSVTKGDPPVVINWLKDGKPIAKATNDPQFAGINIIHVTEFSSTLIFESLRPEHKGNYTCVASNIAGSVSHNASMVIHVPPKWRLEPIDASVIKGRTAIVDCQADGFPPPRIRWSKAEGFLQTPPSEFKAINSSPHLRVFENGSLAIHNTQKSDAGYYLCQANNGIGAGLSKVLKLTVHVAAHFESKFRAETVRKAHEVRLKCESIGDKPLTISWLKDKLAFNPHEDPRYELSESYKVEGEKWGSRTGNLSVSGAETSTYLKNLRPVTHYQLKVFAVNAIGKSEQSEVKHFRSDEEDDIDSRFLEYCHSQAKAPGGPPLHIKAFPMTSSSIRVTWKPPRKDVHFGTIKGYYIGYKVVLGSAGKDESDTFTYKTLEVKEHEFVEECHLTSLQRFTKYAIVVQAYNSKGAGPASEEVIAQTLQN